jgi:hypothetical protein
MLLLDTNVLSELMRPVPNPAVMAWVDAQPAAEVYTSAITEAEIKQGVALLPDGKRKQALADRAAKMFALFQERILPFASSTTNYYVDVILQRQRRGRPIHAQDAQIAAISLEYGLMLATRNTRDFERIDALTVIDPWSADS